MRFINTHRFSPVALGVDRPHKYDLFNFKPQEIPQKKDELKRFILENNILIDEEWWSIQFDRCINGYTVEEAIEPGGDWCIDGEDCFWYKEDCYLPEYDLTIKNRSVHISGRMYFYLNFWLIYGENKETGVKGVIHPKFLAMDFLFWQRIEMMLQQAKDNQDTKTRQAGFSEKYACLAGWNFTFVDASITVILGGQQADADHTFENTVRGLDALRNTQFYLDTIVSNTELRKSKSTLSELRALSAKDKPDAVSRFSPYWVIMEEVGKGKKSWSIDSFKYIEPSIFTEGRKTGFISYLGTGGNMLDGVYDLETRTYDPNGYNLLTFTNKWLKENESCDIKVGHFTPKWMYYILDEEGNPLKQASIEKINELEEKQPINLKSQFRSQQPNFLSEVFTSSIDGYFGREAIELLQRRYNKIKTHKELQIVKKARLKWKDNDNWNKGVEWIDDPENGWLEYIEKPKTEGEGEDKEVYINLYHSGLDSYDQDEALSSDSKGAMRVRKGFLPGEALYSCTVAMLIERPSVAEGGAEKFYEHCLMLCIAYRTQVNIEYSNLRIFDFFKNMGFEYCLKERPQLAFAGMIGNSKVSNKYGTDRALKPQILAIGRNRLDEEFIDRMYFMQEIVALKNFRYDPSGKKFNCDITIAWAECEVSAKEDENYIVMKPKEVLDRDKKSMTVFRKEGNILKKIYLK